MKVVSMAGFVAVVLLVLSLMLVVVGRLELTFTRGIGYIVSLMLLDAAQDAEKRQDGGLAAVASLGSLFAAVLTLV